MKLLLKDTKDIEVLKNCLTSVGEILDEVNLEVSPDGVRIRQPTRDMVAIVDLIFLPSLFEEYKVTEKHKIGLNIDHFLKVLKRAEKDSILEIEKQENKIRVGIKNSITRNFFIPILDIEPTKLPEENTPKDFKAKTEVLTATLRKILKDVKLISDSAVFEANKDSFKISANGDVSRTETTLTTWDKDLLRLEAKEGLIKARYPLEYLEKFLNHKGSETIKLEFATDYPMRVGFRYIDRARLDFILAPRIEQ